MVNTVNAAQRQASSAIHIGDDFSYPFAQVTVNEENFEETIMGNGARRSSSRLPYRYSI